MEVITSTQAKQKVESGLQRRRRMEESILERKGDKTSPWEADMISSTWTHWRWIGDFLDCQRRKGNSRKVQMIRLKSSSHGIASMGDRGSRRSGIGKSEAASG
ncbi:Hypothetical predicted protein [Olea europaea subsp. europaea]|uniref:Uncharacterized protein n=1 Tax=Olea europaea subsp. europaea TaxID=158383 RepID=A0A8S0PMH6_OLEEU|nr:Hypothetical predicted protein [Olea europaea subsp. europaea]